MLKRQTTGSVVCPSCGRLVGVNEKECLNCGRANPGMWGYASLLRRLGQDLGFVQMVIWGCSGLYIATLLTDPGGIRMEGLFSLLSPSLRSLFLFGASGAIPFFQAGRWWTVLSAAWLHGGLLHILFNMMWVRQLAPATASEYGVARMVIIYTVSSITGFFLSSSAGAFLWFLPWPLRGAGWTIGASAPIFGLLGALVYAGKRGSSAVGRQAWGLAVLLFVFGLMMRGVDNWAHLGGFAGGYLMSRWLDPMQPERTDHLIIALLCMGLTILSIVVSIIQGLKFL
ncbi:rhomboid family intramembrane serine protease [Acidobacteria bacterium AH-259-A15]|nr:rhomboid family intramembrane serine protease [Acidobacteria bacterium AH-259-A15]